MIGEILNDFDLGMNRVIGRIRNLASFPMQIATFLGVYGYFFDNQILLFAGLGFGVLGLLTGTAYRILGFQRRETSVSAKQNPQLIEILERVRRIEEGLKKK